MKRDQGHRETGCISGGVGGESSSKGKKNIWEIEEDSGGNGMDELLAVLGYKIKSSDMADVAHKLEQLEMVLQEEEDKITYLSNDAVYYNPSDLSSWVENMLSDLDQTRSQENDLRAIPGFAAFERGKKRVKNETGSSCESGSDHVSTTESTRPVVLVDSQETGVRLVHALMACAEAVQKEDMKLADALVKHVGVLAASQAGAMRKVATYFAEGLARRIYKIYPGDCFDATSFRDSLLMHFYESCPYLKFAHFTANQAILEAFSRAKRVHVVDFGLNQGMQWPPLMQALALRPSGPPVFRLTGIGTPQPDNTDALQDVGWKLSQLAQTIGIEFEFKGFVANSLAEIQPEMLEIRPEIESVAINSIFELHRLLARPGAIEKVFSTIKAARPEIITVVEQEANHNGSVFLDRFTEALHYYSSLFDSLEGPPSQDQVMSELYLGRQILNLVACEGTDRVERHETLAQWRARFEAAGFERVHLGSNAFKQASMLLALFAGADGYRVEENEGCLMLGWHTRPLIATSAWRPAVS